VIVLVDVPFIWPGPGCDESAVADIPYGESKRLSRGSVYRYLMYSMNRLNNYHVLHDSTLWTGDVMFNFFNGPLSSLVYYLHHNVRIYKEYHRVYPLVGIGTLPTPLSPASVSLPPEAGGGGHTRQRARGWGSPNSDDWRKSLALCLLCDLHSTPFIPYLGCRG
jgi:hypothetical protein